MHTHTDSHYRYTFEHFCVILYIKRVEYFLCLLHMCLCVCSASSPVLQFVEDPDMHNAPEINLSASPPAVTFESKALQTEEIEIPQVTYQQCFTIERPPIPIKHCKNTQYINKIFRLL